MEYQMRIYDKRSGRVTLGIGQPISVSTYPAALDPDARIHIETSYGFELWLSATDAQRLIDLLKDALEQLETQAEGKEAR